MTLPTTSSSTDTTAEATNTAWIAGSRTAAGRCSRAGTELPTRVATTPLAIAPKTATPTELPTERANMLAPVATPRCCQVTDDCAATTAGLATKPNPMPMTKHGTARCSSEL